MVARIPRLVVIELIPRLFVLFVIANREWLIQVVCILFVDLVDAVRVVSFSHLFASILVIGVGLAVALLVLFKGRWLRATYTKCFCSISFHPGPPSLRALTRSTSSAW